MDKRESSQTCRNKRRMLSPYDDIMHLDATNTIQTNQLSIGLLKRSPDRFERSGKWTNEEEHFANRLITEFENGTLQDCEEGCTLRSFLARRLRCAPMRISKKFAGRCIGKLVFVKKSPPESAVPGPTLAELEALYQKSYQALSNFSVSDCVRDDDSTEFDISALSEVSNSHSDSSSEANKDIFMSKRHKSMKNKKIKMKDHSDYDGKQINYNAIPPMDAMFVMPNAPEFMGVDLFEADSFQIDANIMMNHGFASSAFLGEPYSLSNLEADEWKIALTYFSQELSDDAFIVDVPGDAGMKRILSNVSLPIC